MRWLVLLAAVALVATACGGSTASPHDAYATQLSAACNDMRAQVEALGKPSDTPLAKLYPPQTRIGKTFLARLHALDVPAGERPTATKMEAQYGYYFQGLRYGYGLLVKRKSQQAFVQTVSAAVDNLNLAKGYAKALGAGDCTKDAFS